MEKKTKVEWRGRFILRRYSCRSKYLSQVAIGELVRISIDSMRFRNYMVLIFAVTFITKAAKSVVHTVKSIVQNRISIQRYCLLEHPLARSRYKLLNRSQLTTVVFSTETHTQFADLFGGGVQCRSVVGFQLHSSILT